MLGQLAGGVGHELRNPLGVMTNAVYYLDAVLADSQPAVREYLEILRTQIGLSEKIIGDLLEYARIRTPEREPVRLAQLTAEQLERVGPLNGTSVRLDFANDLPPASIDRVQIGQVVLNLLTNAVQAMPDGGGSLTIRGTAQAPDCLRLDVTDTGGGIADAHIDQVFEPLFTTKARGIGLGLAVSRSLVIANGGTISVSSRVGEGTTFSLVLPTGVQP
jgi:signal transduction histidine kinase